MNQKLTLLKSQENTNQSELMEEIITDINGSTFKLEQYDDVLVRRIVECVKILSKDEIVVTFKGGYEVKTELQE